MDKPIPDGRLDILLFKDQLISYYFSEIETWKTPHLSPHRALTIIFPDRKVFYPVENIKCWTLYPNSKQFQRQTDEWIRWQHDEGHPNEMPYQCQYCVESNETLAELRKRLAGDK